MRARLIAILPLLAMAGCSGPAVQGSSATARSEAAASARSTATVASGQAGAAVAASSAGGAKAVARSDDLLQFKLSYPAQIGAIPPLAAMIEREAGDAERKARDHARSDHEAAEELGASPRPHHLSFEWKVVADLPRFLSLSNDIAAYTGGAHGMYGTSALIWDRDGSRALTADDVFASPAALQQALGERFCRALDRERRERRGEDNGLGGPFDDCPSVTDLTVLLGSSNGRTFDRMTLYAGPYVAGSYAEGPYEIDLPIDAAVLAAVRPAYRPYFNTA